MIKANKMKIKTPMGTYMTCGKYRFKEEKFYHYENFLGIYE